MNEALLLLLLGLVAIPLVTTIQRPARIFEFPAFMAFTFAVFVLPQAVSLISFPGDIDAESVSAVLAMCCLCMFACIAGYRLAPSRLMVHWASRRIDLGKLFHAGVVFAVTGLGMRAVLAGTEVQYAGGTGGMTGTGTLVLFFQQLAYPGFAILLFCALRRPHLPLIAATLISLIVPLGDVVVGRRENLAILLLTIGLALFYERRVVPPRAAIAAALLFGMLAIPATYQYRQYAAAEDWAGVTNIDLVDNFKRFVGEESILELRNAAAVVESTRRLGSYQFGMGYWNHLVFRFVPAQLVGADLKRSLMFEVWDVTLGTESGFRFPRGSTMTGMGDTFAQFGWLGCLYFVFMAVLFKGLWQASLSRDAMFARVMYVLTVTSGMRAVTHWTADFLPGLIYFSVFVGLAGFYAAVPAAVATVGAGGVGRSVPGGATAWVPRRASYPGAGRPVGRA